MAVSRFPAVRMRRLRAHDFIRRLVAESGLSVNDLVWPLFVREESGAEEIESLPGVGRLSLEQLWRSGEEACRLGIPLVAVFPVVPADRKDSMGREAENVKGLVPRAVAGLKSRFPDLGVMTDVALDPYTSHGHDGLLSEEGEVLNDETVEVLCRQAVMQARVGSDVVAPSDMMDGRIGRIREALDAEGFQQTLVLSYAAKYASAFYGPFRDAIGSTPAGGKRDKRTYQMNPANAREALREIDLDVEEGADMVMIKPGMPYLDVVQRAAEAFDLPVLAYQVSGEYAMLRAAAARGWLDEEGAVMESLLAFKRAGAAAVLTYFAPWAAARIIDGGR